MDDKQQLFPCPWCEKEFKQKGHLGNHLKACPKKPPDLESEEGDITIPLSICPKEISLFPDGRLMFLQVAGHKAGDEFVIESTKLVVGGK